MKIYLDMCSLQRPLDLKTQLRVAVEAEAILNILALCEAGYAELLASDALVFETMQNAHPVRKQYAFGVLATAKQFVLTDSHVEARARAFHAIGIKPLDALHLASAVEVQASTSVHVTIAFCGAPKRWIPTRQRSSHHWS